MAVEIRRVTALSDPKMHYADNSGVRVNLEMWIHTSAGENGLTREEEG